VQRVLLTGAGGQLGTDISIAAAGRQDIELVAFDRSQLDITSGGDVVATIGAENPDVIIHAAAYTAVDDCESNDKHAYAVNGAGTANVVSAAQNVGARVIYVSTDYVFDGTKLEPYVETDTPRPASVYGASKLVGENSAKTCSTSLVSGETACNHAPPMNCSRLVQPHDQRTRFSTTHALPNSDSGCCGRTRSL